MASQEISRTSNRAAWVSSAAMFLVLAACAGGDGRPKPFVVGTTTFDPNLPAEPQLPRDDQVCATLEASNNLVKRPDGALPPEADPSPSGASVAADPAIVNPDQARIQAALDACGAAVDAEVGQFIAAADATAAAAQLQYRADHPDAPAFNISGASGEELAKPMYRASKFAVRLVKSTTGPGDSFISGPLILPSGVTLWIDKGVTLFATRDVMPFLTGQSGRYCANTYSGARAGSSGNCQALINGTRLVNSAVMGEGSIDSRAYAEIVSSTALYPLMKVDLTCSNTYAAYASGSQAANGTPCDDGGTVVNINSTSRNMTWWDLAYLGNMVENGRTGSASQSVFRMMVFNYAKNLTLYKITMNNSANFHFVPAGVDGLTVWGVKLQTPTQAAYANPAGNGNPLYTGEKFTKDNVKNTDAFDPASASRTDPAANDGSGVALNTGSTTTSGTKVVNFDGYLKNVVFAYNFVSTGDDDIVLKGSNNPSPAQTDGTRAPGIDGDRDVRSDRKYGIMIVHNHIYWGHGISIGSETNAGVTNVHVYDNSFNESEEGLRIKSDWARGGEVSNIYYDNICIRDAENALLYTAYYSTRAGGSPTLVPNFHDIQLRNVRIQGTSNVVLVGWQAVPEDTILGTPAIPSYPLTMSMNNVVADSPDKISMESSDAILALDGVNLPIEPSTDTRVVVHGAATKAVDTSQVVDCSRAFVDFPSLYSPGGTTW